jgi:hypothetical protein
MPHPVGSIPRDKGQEEFANRTHEEGTMLPIEAPGFAKHTFGTKATGPAPVPEPGHGGTPTPAAATGDTTKTGGTGETSALSLKDIPNASKSLNFASVGDPHETTGNGNHFDNERTGTFTALASASGDFVLEHVQSHVAGFSDKVTLNTGAAIKSGDDLIKYDAASKKVNVNGKDIDLADGGTFKLPDGGSITKKGADITVTTNKGDTVGIKDQGKWIDITGSVSADRKAGEVKGELGNFDGSGDKTHDLVKADGTTAKSFDDVMDSFTTKDADNLFTHAPAPKSPEQKEIDSLKPEVDKLTKEENKLADERRGLLPDFEKDEPAYEALKKMESVSPELLAPSDKDFIKNHEDMKAKIDDLNGKIKDINGEKGLINDRIGALEKIIDLKGKDKALTADANEAADKRRPLLGEVADDKPKADALKGLADDELAPSDKDFLGHFSDISSTLNDLNKKILDDNEQEKGNEASIADLDKKTKLTDDHKHLVNPAEPVPTPTPSPVAAGGGGPTPTPTPTPAATTTGSTPPAGDPTPLINSFTDHQKSMLGTMGKLATAAATGDTGTLTTLAKSLSEEFAAANQNFTDLVALLPDAKKADFTDKFKPGLDGVKSYLDGIQALMKTPVGAAK